MPQDCAFIKLTAGPPCLTLESIDSCVAFRRQSRWANRRAFGAHRYAFHTLFTYQSFSSRFQVDYTPEAIEVSEAITASHAGRVAKYAGTPYKVSAEH